MHTHRVLSASEIRAQDRIVLTVHQLEPDDASLPSPRFNQLCALAADPNEDTAECARADLFHEFLKREPGVSQRPPVGTDQIINPTDGELITNFKFPN
jgi:hypothetical protein